MTSDVERAREAKTDRFTYPSDFVVGAVRLVALCISKCFWFLSYRGRENIPSDHSGVVVVSNHPTYLDPVWISIPIKKKLRFMAWDQVFEWHWVGKLIRYLGAFPVKPGGSVTKSAVVESLRSLRAGAGLVIFPEGEREFADGEMLEFKDGAVHVAMNAGVPILPVSIRGGNQIWPQRRKYPRLWRRVTVIYHPLLHLPERSHVTHLNDELESLNEKLEEIIRSGIQDASDHSGG